jgi:polyisoprenoid-binding protein YceI
VARYEVDPEASAVAVAARSTVHPVHITAQGLNGFLEGEFVGGRVDLAAPHHARLSLPVRQMRSGNRVQDMEMDRRMETGRYPTIDCEVDRLTDNGAGRYRAIGRLMVHGQTRAVEANVQITETGPGRVVVDVEHAFDMREFGISPPNLFILKVDPQVGVRVRIEATVTG